jgi:thioredoxin reductase (NADPH)
MKTVLIIGDGPAGLSAGLFLAKNGYDTTIFGDNDTATHYALLLNYLGIPEVTGTRLIEIGREQFESFGGTINEGKVSEALQTDDGFSIRLEDGSTFEGDFLVLAAGPAKPFASSFGLEKNEDGGVKADREGRTSVPGLYCVGWATRPKRTQAIISAGEGAAAALSILSQEKGKDFHDFDTPDEDSA